MMTVMNTFEKLETVSVADYKQFLQILAPFAPHITEEIWQEVLGEEESIHLSDWPSYDESLIIENTITLGIQVNGKVRAEIEIAVDEPTESVQEKVLAIPEIKKWIDGKEIKKFIYVPKKIISIVV
jgi:leucyl-tRNA synthetase